MDGRNLMVCDATGTWVLQRRCGQYRQCCRAGLEGPHCYADRREPWCDRPLVPPKKRDTDLLVRNEQLSQQCVLGSYMCWFWARYLMICDATGTWAIQGKCSQYGQCCHVGPGGPQCVADGRAPYCDRPVKLSKERDTSLVARTVPSDCKPGSYRCYRGGRYLLVCAATGKWVIQGACFKYGQCCHDGPGGFHCVADSRASHCWDDIGKRDLDAVDIEVPDESYPASSTTEIAPSSNSACTVQLLSSIPEPQPELESVVEPTQETHLARKGSSSLCTPETYRCDIHVDYQPGYRAIYRELVSVCAPNGKEWKTSAICTPWKLAPAKPIRECCREGPALGIAFCICQTDDGIFS
ncbi:hypothetical protein P154DRAFT_611770 [Amniculicola lignicola CBS 123094]|uniref:Uncharacterized protein n=1 Tax=Amniculicola lignicola CBS 123094 TaxID=1392246 RepID=A0A6A5X163_9PLEO|nr:hypothetical protein P154DRAFT_611770 [Amniculicola lignicola CBS 123094]